MAKLLFTSSLTLCLSDFTYSLPCSPPCFTADVAGRHVGELSTQKLLTALMDSFVWAHHPPHLLKQLGFAHATQTPASSLTHPCMAHALLSLPLALVGQVSLDRAVPLLCVTRRPALISLFPTSAFSALMQPLLSTTVCGLCRASFKPQTVHASRSPVLVWHTVCPWPDSLQFRISRQAHLLRL